MQTFHIDNFVAEQNPATVYILSEARLQDVADQAVHFLHLVAHQGGYTKAPYEWVDMERVNGMSGLWEICSAEAIKFCKEHWPKEDEIQDYWDEQDWYATTEEWFYEHIYDRLAKAPDPELPGS